MKKDHLEITIIVLATSIVLLITMITILVFNIERKIFEERFTPTNEKKIVTSNSFAPATYYNNSDIDNLTSITFNKDNTFIYNYNNCNGKETLTGTYRIDGIYIHMSILEDIDIEKDFDIVILEENLLEYRGPSMGCSPFEYSVYSKK